MQSENIAPQQYTDDFIAKSCRIADVFDKERQNDVYIKELTSSIRNILRYYSTQNP